MHVLLVLLVSLCESVSSFCWYTGVKTGVKLVFTVPGKARGISERMFGQSQISLMTLFLARPAGIVVICSGIARVVCC